MNLTKKNMKEFRDFGATKLESFFDENEISELEKAIHDVSINPSPMIDIFERNEKGDILFFNDFNNWRRIKSLKEFCFKSKIGQAFKFLTGSKEAYFFHDHIICKKAGATKRTPWHLDKTYFMLDGLFNASFWIPTVDLTSEQSLHFAKKSHLERKLLMPKGFNSNKHLESDEVFLPFEESEIDSNFEVINWNLKRGDVLAFTFYTIHSAPSCILENDRNALSLRLVGDNTKFDDRVKNPAPPFTQMGYKAKHGDLIKESWFPKYI